MIMAEFKSAVLEQLPQIIAGLGLGGFTLRFALKDALSNFIAGIMILLYRPFQIGDYLALSGYEGLVSEINLRYTVLRGGKHNFMIPNSMVLTTPLQVGFRKEQEPIRQLETRSAGTKRIGD